MINWLATSGSTARTDPSAMPSASIPANRFARRLERTTTSTRSSLGSAWSAGKHDGINVAAVATASPAGRATLQVKLPDTRDAVAAGADAVLAASVFHFGPVDAIAEVKKAIRDAGFPVR